MTCIVGLIDKGDIYMGGDSAGSTSHHTDIRADEKVFINGPMIFGFTSSFRMGQLLRYSLNIPKQSKKMDDYKYMVTLFINVVRNCLKKGGYAKKCDETETGGIFLVGYKNKLYCIEKDYQVACSYKSYHAIGCGDSYAFGSLYTTQHKDYKLPKERIMLALHAAEEFSPYVRAPFLIKELRRKK